jgi:hypothetical protein
MKLTLKRYSDNGKSTLGLLFLNDEFFCYALEDAHHDEKIAGKTRIPAGEYKIILRNDGLLHSKYSKRYAPIHKGMLWLLDVPGFEYIYIHVVNNHTHTKGCILVGNRSSNNRIEQGFVAHSGHCYEKLYPLVAKPISEGEHVSILIEDEPNLKGEKNGHS